MKNNSCPNCGSKEFITEPNQYDILKFSKYGFETIDTEVIDEYKVFCRECNSEIDVEKSETNIVLKNVKWYKTDYQIMVK